MTKIEKKFHKELEKIILSKLERGTVDGYRKN